MKRLGVLKHRLLMLALIPSFWAGLAQGQDAATTAVVGYWASESSIFEISTDDLTLQGHVRALKNPVYLETEDNGRVGEVRRDDANPDPGLQDRPLIGLSMFSEYRFEDGQWQGKIYDPESGKTYQSHMKVNKEGELEIRGYVGLPMFGRTAIFVPISRCTGAIQAMLPQTEAPNPCQNP